jgi:uncharacterized protein (DUF4415 family)
MKKSQIVSYTSEELKRLPSESDWEAAAAMTDAEIEAAVAEDPDDSTDWMDRVRVVHRPEKQRVLAFYDAYVVDYFKREGRGYQARMNAVLKAYVDFQLEKAQSRSE